MVGDRESCIIIIIIKGQSTGCHLNTSCHYILFMKYVTQKVDLLLQLLTVVVTHQVKDSS